MNKTLLSLLLLSLSASLIAGSPEEEGLKIATLIDKHDRGWISETADVTMVLKNQHGQESKREMKIKSLEDQNHSDDWGDKSLTTFKTPRDVKGTSFLSFAHATGADQQWLYLPALRRVKTIASDNKSGPFMGSEFAFEDISSQEVNKYTYKFIRHDKLNGLDVAVIERYPVSKYSGYSKQIVWVDTTHYRVHKIEFFDRKKSALKTLIYSGYKQYGKVWRADKMEVSNSQSGKSTQLIWANYQHNTGISARDFNKNALARLK